MPVQFWPIPERIPIRVAFGREAPEAFLLRALPAYQAVQYLNRMAEPGQRVVGVGVDNLRFYLDAPLLSLEQTPRLHSRLTNMTEAQIAANLADSQVEYLIINHPDPSAQARNFP